jgi:hypothetical protein
MPSDADAAGRADATVEQVSISCDLWLRGAPPRESAACLDAMSALYAMHVRRTDRRGICVPDLATPASFAYAYVKYTLTKPAEASELSGEPWQVVADDALRAAWPCSGG